MAVLNTDTPNPPNSPFEGRVRCRVCGLLLSSEGLLMIKHRGIGPLGYLWAPPGGGIDFGYSAEQALRNEFREETGLEVEVNDYLFANEYRDARHHAIELFFAVKALGGKLALGTDPELGDHEQMIMEVSYLSDQDLAQIPASGKHNIFRECSSIDSLAGLRGFFKFANK